VATAHAALIPPDSLLGGMVDREEAPADGDFLRLPINSSHHQAIGIPGDGLRVTARCPQDGVIEAVEGGQASEGATAHFVLGLQWHPERSVAQSATSRAIFQRFVGAAAVWQPRPVRVSVA
jgi:putative glutamine amidotransferase